MTNLEGFTSPTSAVYIPDWVDDSMWYMAQISWFTYSHEGRAILHKRALAEVHERFY